MRTDRPVACPCGSGKTYQTCCRPKRSLRSLTDARVDCLARELKDRLSVYLHSPAVTAEMDRAMVVFFIELAFTNRRLPPQLVEMALDWIAFAHRTRDDGAVLCSRFAHGVKGLSDDEQAVLAAWSHSSPGYFIVEAVEAGHVHLRRLPDDRAFTVRAPGTSLRPGVLISAWLLPVLSTYCFGFHWAELSAWRVEPVRHLLQVEFAILQRQRPGVTWDELYRLSWPRLYEVHLLTSEERGNISRIAPPVGPSVCWDGGAIPDAAPWWHQVPMLLRRELENVSPEGSTAVDGATRLWWDAALALRPKMARPQGWAAGIAYLYRKEILCEDQIRQAEVAVDFGVSADTVRTRSRQVASALGVVSRDERYVDLLNPQLRLDWFMYCATAAGPQGQDARWR